jgi:diadenosine tetraphosphate (Ap4A) HIT family hydrolase
MADAPDVEGAAIRDCPFCRIARGEDQSPEILVEAEEWLAFFPTSPATPGHTLVIPRTHVPHFWALDSPLACVLATACIHVGRAVEMALDPDGMNLITSRGGAAEQTVPHLHLHILPRWGDDAVDTIWPPKRPSDSTRLAQLAMELRSALGAG